MGVHFITNVQIPESMNTVDCLWHIFAVINIRCLWIKYLKNKKKRCVAALNQKDRYKAYNLLLKCFRPPLILLEASFQCISPLRFFLSSFTLSFFLSLPPSLPLSLSPPLSLTPSLSLSHSLSLSLPPSLPNSICSK